MSEIFLSIYALCFDSLKQLLEFLQKKDPNPGLVNSVSVFIFIIENAIEGIKETDSTKEFLESLKNLILDGRTILINEYNR
mmetsp:Transcript_7338/g.8296  ORF Transcript_7338/g.8296 Transcript_7338/m.8296 type:complete len:81 (+) Transcript_7338:368-610(+)